MADPQPVASERPPRVPPGWFVRIAWAVHRAIYRLTGGRRGLWRATREKWGTFRLHTVGRRTGRERIAILGYYEDGANLVTLAMNGWQEGQPGWWINLQAEPDATIEIMDGSRTVLPRAVHARAAQGDERARLLAMFRGADRYAAHRSTETTVVVLEPRQDASA
jgi:deazaflavin-dependent oxidoreductase (nitroreductase family)